MGMANCTECGETFSFETLPRRGKVCFRCHLKTIRMGFSEGRETFHGETIRERCREIESEAAAQGRQIELVGKRWV